MNALPFHIRPAIVDDAQAIAHVQVEGWRSTYTGIIPTDFLVAMNTEERAAGWRNGIANPNGKTGYFVAHIGSQVVGFACGGPERDGQLLYKGELYAIYLLREYQGQGIGRALMQVVAHWLFEQGYSNLLIWVLAGNNSGIGFYEALGGVRVGSKPIELGGAALEELGYGWENIHSLLERE